MRSQLKFLKLSMHFSLKKNLEVNKLNYDENEENREGLGWEKGELMPQNLQQILTLNIFYDRKQQQKAFSRGKPRPKL